MGASGFSETEYHPLPHQSYVALRLYVYVYVCVPAFNKWWGTDVLVRQTGRTAHHWKELRRAQQLIQHIQLIQHTFQAKVLTGAQHA